MTTTGAGPEFVPAQVLYAAFHAEVVAPLLDGTPHAAALWGPGSDVLGYDTAQSTDHGWGPHAQVFVTAPAGRGARGPRRAACRRRSGVGRSATAGTTSPSSTTSRRDPRRVAERAPRRRPRAGMTTLDWLTIPQQVLLEVAGPVFADPDGELRRVQGLLAAFPPQVRLWVLACQWDRVGEEEAFVGRAAQVGDELGARIVAARLVRELMRVGVPARGCLLAVHEVVRHRVRPAADRRRAGPVVRRGADGAARTRSSPPSRRSPVRTTRPGSRRPSTRPPVPTSHAPVPGAGRGPVRRGLPGRAHRSGARGAAADRLGGPGGRQHPRSLEHPTARRLRALYEG